MYLFAPFNDNLFIQDVMIKKGFQNATGLSQQGILEGLNGLLNASHQIPKNNQKLQQTAKNSCYNCSKIYKKKIRCNNLYIIRFRSCERARKFEKIYGFF